MTSTELTKGALDALNHQDFLLAQKLFQQSTKKHRDYISYHNLGFFYAEYGKTKKNGTVQPAHFDAYKNYLQSHFKHPTSLNSMQLGKMFYERRKFRQAEKWFFNSFSLKHDYTSAYCCGAAIYMNGNPENSVQYYILAQQLCKNAFRPQIDTALAYSYLAYDVKAAREAFYQFRREMDLQDQFTLAYCVGDFAAAKSKIKALLSEYVIDNSTLAMVYDCLLKFLNKDQAKRIIVSYTDCLIELPDYKKRMGTIYKIISDQVVLQNNTKEIRYTPVLPNKCGFLFCPQHGNHE